MQIDREKVNEMAARENRRFIEERPRSMALLRKAKAHMPGGVPMAWMVSLYAHAPFFVDSAQGAYITDIDGHRYLDMNLADTSMGCGYAPPAVAEAVTLQFNRGSQFLLPTQDTVFVSQALADRFDLPGWQFTLSASSANTEAIRISRAFTARDRVLVFDGKYHGLLDETCHLSNPDTGNGNVTPELRGLAKDAGKATDIVPYNDLASAERILHKRQTACVLVEAAITNVGGVLMPQPGFLDGLRELTRSFGSTLVIDETHTHMCAYGGLKREWGLDVRYSGPGQIGCSRYSSRRVRVVRTAGRFHRRIAGQRQTRLSTRTGPGRHFVRQRPADRRYARDARSCSDRGSTTQSRGTR